MKKCILGVLTFVLTSLIVQCTAVPEVRTVNAEEPRVIYVVDIHEDEYEELPVLADGVFKSYMDGEMITDRSSRAYKQLSKMEVKEGIYREGEYLGIAISSYYGQVGDKLRITLSTGITIKTVITDIKQESQLDENHAHPDGSIIEFIVDTKTLSKKAKKLGSLDCIYTGSIEKIERENNETERLH